MRLRGFTLMRPCRDGPLSEEKLRSNGRVISLWLVDARSTPGPESRRLLPGHAVCQRGEPAGSQEMSARYISGSLTPAGRKRRIVRLEVHERRWGGLEGLPLPDGTRGRSHLARGRRSQGGLRGRAERT